MGNLNNAAEASTRLSDTVKVTHLTRQYLGRIGIIQARRELCAPSTGTRSIEVHNKYNVEKYDTLIAMGDTEISQQAAVDIYLPLIRFRQFSHAASTFNPPC
jgi:hypothetical protein